MLADVAVVTGLYLASYRLGSALGQTLAGAVWTQRMPLELANRIGNQTVALSTYNAPYVTIESYPIGTPERDGMVASYAAVQKLLAGMYIIYSPHWLLVIACWMLTASDRHLPLCPAYLLVATAPRRLPRKHPVPRGCRGGLGKQGDRLEAVVEIVVASRAK